MFCELNQNIYIYINFLNYDTAIKNEFGLIIRLVGIGKLTSNVSLRKRFSFFKDNFFLYKRFT